MIKLFSPNMLKTFESCPKKFELKYVKNISMPIDDSIFETGKNIHAMASYYLRRENITNLEQELTEQEKLLWEYLKETEYLKYEVVETEYNLTVKIGDFFFGGRLDAVVKNKDDYYILDYKTGKIPQNTTYDYQTMIYMLCVQKFFQTNEVNFIYMDLKHKLNAVVGFSEDLGLEFENRLKSVAENIQKQTYTASQKECKTCEYRIICYDKKLPD